MVVQKYCLLFFFISPTNEKKYSFLMWKLRKFLLHLCRKILLLSSSIHSIFLSILNKSFETRKKYFISFFNYYLKFCIFKKCSRIITLCFFIAYFCFNLINMNVLEETFNLNLISSNRVFGAKYQLFSFRK